MITLNTRKLFTTGTIALLAGALALPVFAATNDGNYSGSRTQRSHGTDSATTAPTQTSPRTGNNSGSQAISNNVNNASHRNGTGYGNNSGSVSVPNNGSNFIYQRNPATSVPTMPVPSGVTHVGNNSNYQNNSNYRNNPGYRDLPGFQNNSGYQNNTQYPVPTITLRLPVPPTRSNNGFDRDQSSFHAQNDNNRRDDNSSAKKRKISGIHIPENWNQLHPQNRDDKRDNR